jgi:hypothetical protein
MKKWLFLALAATFSFSTQAQELTENKEYVVVEGQQRSAQPEVIEFFSFYCPHCYSFEAQYLIPQKIAESLPEGTSFKQYHVDFLGPQSENLTRAWALALAINAEEKVKIPLFKAAQTNALKSMDDIRQIFIDNGVSAEQFDGGINSFAVNGLVTKQQNLVKKYQVRGVPDFYVNGKYRVNMEGLAHDENHFIDEYVQTVKGLLQK